MILSTLLTSKSSNSLIMPHSQRQPTQLLHHLVPVKFENLIFSTTPPLRDRNPWQINWLFNVFERPPSDKYAIKCKWNSMPPYLAWSYINGNKMCFLPMLCEQISPAISDSSRWPRECKKIISSQLFTTLNQNMSYNLHVDHQTLTENFPWWYRPAKWALTDNITNMGWTCGFRFSYSFTGWEISDWVLRLSISCLVWKPSGAENLHLYPNEVCSPTGYSILAFRLTACHSV